MTSEGHSYLDDVLHSVRVLGDRCVERARNAAYVIFSLVVERWLFVTGHGTYALICRPPIQDAHLVFSFNLRI